MEFLKNLTIDHFELLVTLIVGMFASTGFWTYISNRNGKKDVRAELLIGLAHDRIIFLGLTYISRGWITGEEFENIHDYLYIPYSKMGGNGSAERIITEVKKLPIRVLSVNDAQPLRNPVPINRRIKKTTKKEKK